MKDKKFLRDCLSRVIKPNQLVFTLLLKSHTKDNPQSSSLTKCLVNLTRKVWIIFKLHFSYKYQSIKTLSNLSVIIVSRCEDKVVEQNTFRVPFDDGSCIKSSF